MTHCVDEAKSGSAGRGRLQSWLAPLASSNKFRSPGLSKDGSPLGSCWALTASDFSPPPGMPGSSSPFRTNKSSWCSIHLDFTALHQAQPPEATDDTSIAGDVVAVQAFPDNPSITRDHQQHRQQTLSSEFQVQLEAASEVQCTDHGCSPQHLRLQHLVSQLQNQAACMNQQLSASQQLHADELSEAKQQHAVELQLQSEELQQQLSAAKQQHAVDLQLQSEELQQQLSAAKDHAEQLQQQLSAAKQQHAVDLQLQSEELQQQLSAAKQQHAVDLQLQSEELQQQLSAAMHQQAVELQRQLSAAKQHQAEELLSMEGTCKSKANHAGKLSSGHSELFDPAGLLYYTQQLSIIQQEQASAFVEQTQELAQLRQQHALLKNAHSQVPGLSFNDTGSALGSLCGLPTFAPGQPKLQCRPDGWQPHCIVRTSLRSPSAPLAPVGCQHRRSGASSPSSLGTSHQNDPQPGIGKNSVNKFSLGSDAGDEAMRETAVPTAGCESCSGSTATVAWCSLASIEDSQPHVAGSVSTYDMIEELGSSPQEEEMHRDLLPAEQRLDPSLRAAAMEGGQLPGQFAQLDSKVASLHHQQVCLEASHAALATRCDAMAVHTQQLAAQLCLSEQERHRLALQCAEWQQHAQHGLVHATVMRAVAAVRRREELELSLKARLAQRLAGVKGSTPSQAAAAAGQPLGVPTPAASPVTGCPANSQAESMVGQPAPKPEALLQDLGCRFCGTPFAPSYHKLEAAQLAELPACPVLGIEGLSWKTKVGLATGLQAGEGPGSALQALGQAVGDDQSRHPQHLRLQHLVSQLQNQAACMNQQLSASQQQHADELSEAKQQHAVELQLQSEELQQQLLAAMSDLTDRLGDSSGLIPMPHPLDCITCHGWGAAGNQAVSGCHEVHADVTGQHAQHSASTATLAHPPSSLNGTLGTSTTTCSTGHLICDTLYGPPARLPSPSNRLLSRTATNPAAECGQGALEAPATPSCPDQQGLSQDNPFSASASQCPLLSHSRHPNAAGSKPASATPATLAAASPTPATLAAAFTAHAIPCLAVGDPLLSPSDSLSPVGRQRLGHLNPTSSQSSPPSRDPSPLCAFNLSAALWGECLYDHSPRSSKLQLHDNPLAALHHND